MRAVWGDVATMGPFFAVDTDPVEGADPSWRPMVELYTDPGPLRDRIAQVRRVLDTDNRVAASIAFQGLAALIVSAPFAAVVLHGMAPRLTTLRWRVPEGGSWSLWCAAGDAVAVDDPATGGDVLASVLFDGHLVPLIRAIRSQVSISERLLWGSVASAVASAKRLVGVHRPEAASRATDVAARLLALGPLSGTGNLRAPDPPDVGWTFRRRSCCLFYRVPGGGLCGDCVLLPA